MKSILKLPISAVSFIFSQVSDIDSKVCWIRNPNYSQQLYISPSYEKLWGIKPEKLYEHPLSWNETVVNTDIIQKLINRTPNSNTTYFQIRDADGKLKFIKDTCFHLFDLSGELMAVAGISEDLAFVQWEAEMRNNKSAFHATDMVTAILDQFTSQSIVLPKTEIETTRHPKIILTTDGETVKLTARESTCLKYLYEGQTAKQIARLLRISPRTVEVHINNMKSKLGCRSRFELINKLHIRK